MEMKKIKVLNHRILSCLELFIFKYLVMKTSDQLLFAKIPKAKAVLPHEAAVIMDIYARSFL